MLKKIYISVFIVCISYSINAQKTYPGSLKILGRSLSTIPQEAKGIAVYPFEHPNSTLKFAGINIALIAVDVPSTKFAQKHFDNAVTINLKNILPIFSGMDDYIVGGLATLYIGSVAFKYEKGQVAALASIKATAYSVVYTHLVLKTIFGRQRPYTDLNNPDFSEAESTSNNWNFFNVHKPSIGSTTRGTGFPSFHFLLMPLLWHVL